MMDDLTQYVLPFVGTEAEGNVFPGSCRPFGMVKAGPDLLEGEANAYAGYLPNGNFTGFSLMHLSGTGGIPMYGVVSQLPVVGEALNEGNATIGRARPDRAEVGYYNAQTSQNVSVELAATDHAAMYQYTFPDTRSNIVIDLSHRLPSFRGQGLSQRFEGANITIDNTGRYQGSTSFSNGYNVAPKWTIYFCGVFDQRPIKHSLFGVDAEDSTNRTADFDPTNDPAGTIFTFDSRLIRSKVGISFISAQKACDFIQQELPEDAAIDDVVRETKNIWNEKVLSRVTTTEENLADLQSLYTSLYVMHQLPSNRTGENSIWQSGEPYFDDIYTLWDLFRTSTPLLQILQPQAYQQFIRSLIDTWRNDGYLPDGRVVNYNGPVEGGSNANMVLADAYVKGAQGSINWTDGYAAMVKDAEVTPPNNFDPRADDASTKEGRGALPDWLEFGFITTAFSRSVSNGVEYSGNDFALSQVARGEGDRSDVEKYLQRSRQWRNYWNPDVESLGFRGFAMPRNTTGGFVPHDPLDGGGYWRDPFYQASPWEYSLNAHHDMTTLVKLCGGPERFVSRLQALFEYEIDPADPQVRIFDPGNQPGFASPYLFHFGERPDLSVTTSRQIARNRFRPISDGLPGNADAGAMQSWLLWNMIGLYPLPAQTTFLIHSPWFDNLNIKLGDNKLLTINSTNGDKDSAIHVQSLYLNGKEWRQPWLIWTDIFAEGGTLKFVLGPEPNPGWFNSSKDLLPPSPASSDSENIDFIDSRSPTSGRTLGIYVLLGLGLVLSITAFLYFGLWTFRCSFWPGCCRHSRLGGSHQQKRGVPRQRGREQPEDEAAEEEEEEEEKSPQIYERQALRDTVMDSSKQTRTSTDSCSLSSTSSASLLPSVSFQLDRSCGYHDNDDAAVATDGDGGCGYRGNV